MGDAATRSSNGREEEEGGVKVEVKRVPDWYVKCPRCWRWHPMDLNYDGLCDRCCGMLAGTEHEPLIEAAYAKQRAMAKEDWIERRRK